MNVVKTRGSSQGMSSQDKPGPRLSHNKSVNADGETRAAVMRLLLTHGPATAAQLAAQLSVTGTAIRRHLDILVQEDAVTTRRQPQAAPRERGRPARVYMLTDVGRQHFPHEYDDLAADMIDYLVQTQGEEALTDFARHRAETIVATVRPQLDAATSVAERMRILADALQDSGYVPSLRSVGQGAQLSQHHCPISHVAARYPQFCEQELHVFSQVLQTHAQRVATIARGDSFCTTFVPDAHTSNDDNNVTKGITP